MNTPTMTLDQFRATGRDVADIVAELPHAAGYTEPGTPGRIYDGDCYIEGTPETGWTLTIHNTIMRSGAYTLAELEHELYEFLIGEGAL